MGPWNVHPIVLPRSLPGSEDTCSEPSAHREPSSTPEDMQCSPPDSGGLRNAEQMLVSAPRRGSEKQIDPVIFLMQILKL